MIRTSVENMKAVKEITQFMVDNDLSKEQIIFVINGMTNLVDKNPHSYFSRENIEYLKQEITERFIKNDR